MDGSSILPASTTLKNKKKVTKMDKIKEPVFAEITGTKYSIRFGLTSSMERMVGEIIELNPENWKHSLRLEIGGYVWDARDFKIIEKVPQQIKEPQYFDITELHIEGKSKE